MSARGIRTSTGMIAMAGVFVGSLASCPGGAPERLDAPARTAAAFAGASADVARAATAPSRDDAGVTVALERVADRVEIVSFGVPVRRGRLRDVRQVSVESHGGRRIDAAVRELLPDLDARGRRVGVRAFLVQLPGEVVGAGRAEVRVRWDGETLRGARAAQPFEADAVSFDSPVEVDTAARTIDARGGTFRLVETRRQKARLFVGREARVVATFPHGYVARTGILGELAASGDVGPSAGAGLAFFSDALKTFTRSSIYAEAYALNPHPESVPDPTTDFSSWLYDRCATYLMAHAHLGDVALLRHAMRTCSHYARSIDLAGERAGIFRGKAERDTKYSHARGLFAYYALTGDDAALAAGTAIADMWEREPYFVLPYRSGKLRGPDKLWTERLLATSLEGIVYGALLTGQGKRLDAARELVRTAHRHVAGDRAELAALNPGHSFPPQNCFVHSAEQQGEGEAHEPWCSPWMSAMLVEPLLRYEEQTGDPHAGEIVVRLARYVRDVGTSYFDNDVKDDRFLAPKLCDDPTAGERRRRLVPLYGAALRQDGTRAREAEWSDFEHCADVTLLTAAALRALATGTKLPATGPIGQFSDDRSSITALHHDLASCAERTFQEQTRPRRDPRVWTSRELAAGAGAPEKFIDDNRIGFPIHVVMPARKLSWWFNGSLLGFSLLRDAGVRFDALAPGQVPGPPCRPK